MLDVLMKAAGYCASADEKKGPPKGVMSRPRDVYQARPRNKAPMDGKDSSHEEVPKTTCEEPKKPLVQDSKPKEPPQLLFNIKSYPKRQRDDHLPATKPNLRLQRDILGRCDKRTKPRRKTKGFGVTEHRLQQQSDLLLRKPGSTGHNQNRSVGDRTPMNSASDD